MNEFINTRKVEAEDAKTWFKFKNKVWREAYKDIFPKEVFIDKEKSFMDNIYNNNEKNEEKNETLKRYWISLKE